MSKKKKPLTPGAEMLREWRRDGIKDTEVKKAFLTHLFIYVGFRMALGSLVFVLSSLWLNQPFWLLIIIQGLMEIFVSLEFWKQIKDEMGS